MQFLISAGYALILERRDCVKYSTAKYSTRLYCYI